MNVKGKTIQVLGPMTGESAKGQWRKQDFVIETADQYPKTICFTIWGDKVAIPSQGETVDVHFNAESREYQGRWYTDLTAWKIEKDNQSPAPAVNAPIATQEEIAAPQTEDTLPF